MTAAEHVCYTLINAPSDSDCPSEASLKSVLERGELKAKTEALKKAIVRMLNGEKLPGLIMSVIRFVLPLQDHGIKKLLLLFWEVAPRTGADGEPLQEMILVCDAYRKDLQHPNHFVRGSALRFLSKLREPELLEPLVPAIRACLEHPHSYVRRNAVLAVDAISRRQEHLVPDARELVSDFLAGERDAGCKRNAFVMLIRADRRRAADYLSACVDQVPAFADVLQLAAVELIHKACRAEPSERARFVRCVYGLLQSSCSPAVRYEAAGTLVALSGAPTAVRAAAQCYVDLLVGESDNNVKLIVLERLAALKQRAHAHERVLQDLSMDVLRALSTSSDLEVRKKTLRLALDLVSSRSAEELVSVLTKEVARTGRGRATEDADADEYRRLLVRTLHSCAVRFPDTAALVLPALMALLGDSDDEAAAADVLEFVREAAQRLDHLRPLVVGTMLEVFRGIGSAKTYRGALWILGEYCSTAEDIRRAMGEVSRSLGEIPAVDSAASKEEAGGGGGAAASTAQKLLTEMGTYATQSALCSSAPPSRERDAPPPLRAFLMDGDFYVAASLATMLTKVALRYVAVVPDRKAQNSFVAQAMLVMATVLRLGRSALPRKPITEDAAERISLCLRVLSEGGSPLMARIFTEECRESLSRVLSARLEEEKRLSSAAKESEKGRRDATAQVDEPIRFAQLTARGGAAARAEEEEDPFELALSAAVGGHETPEASSNKLSTVTQLTGFSDPVYAEAYVRAERYDVVLDVLLVNRTSDTLQNVALELAASGDLRLVEAPAPLTLGPHGFAEVKAGLKVVSAESGRVIFGNVVYDVSGGAAAGPGGGGDRRCIVLSEVRIDVTDHVQPAAACTDGQFRRMWAEFEWENKVTVDTELTDMKDYLGHVLAVSNMRCLTPPDEAPACGFMAANLYMRSVFGEDVLANVSIEKPLRQHPTGPEAPVRGHIRIRAKNKAMALSLGDKISFSQRKVAV